MHDFQDIFPGLSRTLTFNFQDFPGPKWFSRTFQVLEFSRKNPGLSRRRGNRVVQLTCGTQQNQLNWTGPLCCRHSGKNMIICMFQPRVMTLKNYRSMSKILHLIWRSLVCHVRQTSMHSSTAASIHLWRQLPESICPLRRLLSQVNRCSVLQDNCTPTGAVAYVERMRKNCYFCRITFAYSISTIDCWLVQNILWAGILHTKSLFIYCIL